MTPGDYWRGSVACFAGALLCILNYMLFIFDRLENSISLGHRYDHFQLNGLFADISRSLLLAPEWQLGSGAG
ncbi:MAG: hypothetical protein ACFFE8_06205 [Candidatus Heimdallarchaeota archaeon]